MTKQTNKVLRLWARFSTTPVRRWLFSRFVCFRAPYFGSIRPMFESIRAGRVEASMRKRRRVKNHIGTVHAIAMCNLAELAAGTMMEASTPSTHRWIPKNMTVEYIAKAKTDVRAVAELDPLPEFTSDPGEVRVPVAIQDHHGQIVVQAEISMWVSPRKSS